MPLEEKVWPKSREDVFGMKPNYQLVDTPVIGRDLVIRDRYFDWLLPGWKLVELRLTVLERRAEREGRILMATGEVSGT